MTPTQRAAATTQWLDEYQNKSGGPWLGRAAMEAAKTARVAALEAALLTEHGIHGHGPFVVNYHVGTGPASTITFNKDLSDARQGELRTRRCICGTAFTQGTEPTIYDDRTLDGMNRDMHEIAWPGNWFEAQQRPVQPRDTTAIRGITDVMPNMVEGVRP